MNIETWITYLFVVLVAVLMPGPSTLLTAVHSVKYGFVKSLSTILGIVSGVVLVSVLSVIGVGAIAKYSGIAFIALKIVGAVYLIGLGLLLWRRGLAPVPPSNNADVAESPDMYSQGVVVAITSPKTLTVSTAIFPQFVDPTTALVPQFTVLIVTFGVLTTAYLLLTAKLAQRTMQNLGERPSRVLGQVAEGTIMGAGGMLLLSAGKNA